MKILKRKKINKLIITFTLFLIFGIITFFNNNQSGKNNILYELNNIPKYDGKPYIFLNNNQPNFLDNEYYSSSYEKYSPLDNLGRCGEAIANIGIDIMPKEERGSIGNIKPSGWQTIKYENVDGKYLYNRCHLIGYQLTGENANEQNLITCTRNMNAKVMIEFENKVAKYINETKNHVLYKVTPNFQDNNLVASGVQIQAKSVEDKGKAISFNIYIYNVENGIDIDYKTGNSWLIKK